MCALREIDHSCGEYSTLVGRNQGMRFERFTRCLGQNTTAKKGIGSKKADARKVCLFSCGMFTF